MVSAEPVTAAGAVDSVVLLTGGVPDRLTGGNIYNRHLCAALATAGIPVVTTTVPPSGHPRLAIVDSIALEVGFRWVAGRPPGARVAALMHMLPSLHAPHSDERLRRRRLEMAFLRQADLIIVPSRSLADWMHRLDVPEARVRIIPPGKDGPQPPQAVAGEPATGEPATRKSTGADAVRLLCVANWFPVKNIHILVRATADLPVSVHLDLIGDPEVNPSYAAQVYEAIERSSLSARVNVRGPVPPEGMGACYTAADIFVLPSAVEGYPTVVAEALWFGLPVVAAAVGGVPELVTPGVEGLLVAPGKPRALAQTLLRLCTDAQLRQRTAAAAAARGQRLPTWSDARHALREALLPLLG